VEQEVSELDNALKQVLCGALKCDEISYSDTIDTVDMWDSMTHMEIMVALENNYAVRVEPGEIIMLTSIKAIQDYLISKGVL
jgi:acyl carrier protein